MNSYGSWIHKWIWGYRGSRCLDSCPKQDLLAVHRAIRAKLRKTLLSTSRCSRSKPNSRVRSPQAHWQSEPSGSLLRAWSVSRAPEAQTVARPGNLTFQPASTCARPPGPGSQPGCQPEWLGLKFKLPQEYYTKLYWFNSAQSPAAPGPLAGRAAAARINAMHRDILLLVKASLGPVFKGSQTLITTNVREQHPMAGHTARAPPAACKRNRR